MRCWRPNPGVQLQRIAEGIVAADMPSGPFLNWFCVAYVDFRLFLNFSRGIVSVAATGSILQLNEASAESALAHRIEVRPETLTSKKGRDGGRTIAARRLRSSSRHLSAKLDPRRKLRPAPAQHSGWHAGDVITMTGRQQWKT